MAGDRATARSLCVQAVGGGLSGLAAQFSDENALVVCIHVMRYTNRRLSFSFPFTIGQITRSQVQQQLFYARVVSVEERW